MARKSTTKLPLKRRRLALTNYQKRLRLIRSGLPRVVVRRSLRYTTVQIIEYHPEGDRVVAGTTSKALIKHGWKSGCGNVSSAYLTGYLVGLMAKKNGVESAVLDTGLYKPTKGSKIFAALKGVIDAGINVPVREDHLPEEGYIKGEGIDNDRAVVVETVKKNIEESVR